MWVVDALLLTMAFIFLLYAFAVTYEIISLLPHSRNGREVFKNVAVLVVLAVIYFGAGLALVGIWNRG